ncbi:hypothetical protein Bca101_038725 [Brassica carinata]
MRMKPSILPSYSPHQFRLLTISAGAVGLGGIKMANVPKIGKAVYQGPSIVKEIIYGIALGLAAGGLWKMHHWNNQRRTREFYDLLEKGEISVVVTDE